MEKNQRYTSEKVNFENNHGVFIKDTIFDQSEIIENDFSGITDKEKLLFAKQILGWLLASVMILLFLSFIPYHHDNAFIHFAQQILPVITLIIGSYFNK